MAHALLWTPTTQVESVRMHASEPLLALSELNLGLSLYLAHVSESDA